MIGVIANTLAVALGSSIGLIAKKGIPESWNDTILKGMGLLSLYIGITGIMDGATTLVLVFSVVLGAIIGRALDLDGRLNRGAERLERRFTKEEDSSQFAQGIVTASLLFCVGAMTIVGPMDAALRGDNTLLFTKSFMDGVTSIVFAATFGVGVLFSAAVVFTIEGAIYGLAILVAPYLSDALIGEVSCVGALLILALGTNLIGATKIKVMNYVPGIFLPIILLPLYTWVTSL